MDTAEIEKTALRARVMRYAWRSRPFSKPDDPEVVFEAWAEELPGFSVTGSSPPEAIGTAISLAVQVIGQLGGEVPTPLFDSGRVKQANLKLSEGEESEIAAAAAREGRSKSEFLRDAALKAARQGRLDNKDLERVSSLIMEARSGGDPAPARK